MSFSGVWAILLATMVVRMRRNHSQTAQRRSHHALTVAQLQKCECGALRQSHRACQSCGKYNGRVAIDVVGTAERNARRTKRREKELMASGQITPDTKKKDSKKKED